MRTSKLRGWLLCCGGSLLIFPGVALADSDVPGSHADTVAEMLETSKFAAGDLVVRLIDGALQLKVGASIEATTMAQETRKPMMLADGRYFFHDVGPKTSLEINDVDLGSAIIELVPSFCAYGGFRL